MMRCLLLTAFCFIACGPSPVKNGALRYGERPFPSDDFRDAAGRIIIPGLDTIIPEQSQIFQTHLTTLNGFGLRPLIEFPFETPLEHPETAKIELTPTIPLETRWNKNQTIFAATPELGQVLQEGTEYTATLTIDGKEAATTRFTTQQTTDTLQKARDALQASKLTFPNPALIFDTPEELTALLGTPTKDAEMRERLGWSNPTGLAHEHVGMIATGVMTTTRFIREEKGDEPNHETFELDPNTRAPRVIDPNHEIPVTFVLPKAAPTNPEKGHPIILLGHGLGASRHAVLTFAEPLTEAGFAIAAIDFDGHGSRFNPADQTNNNQGAISEFTGVAAMKDGFGDITGPVTTLALLRNFKNLSAVRDSIRQSALDLSALAKLLKTNPELPNNEKLDATKLAYLGESFGSVVGAVFAGIEPEVELFILDVPGAGIVDLEIAGSPGLYGPVLLLARSLYNFEGRFDRFHQAAALSQAIVDGADPLSYARHVKSSARHLVAIEVLGDEVMSNIGTRALAHALDLDVLTPALDLSQGPGSTASPAAGNKNGITRVLVEYSPATHGANWSSEFGTLNYQPGFPHPGETAEEMFPMLPAPIEIKNPIRETFTQVIETLRTFQTGTPVVRSVKPPLADFDGDGRTDDRDPEPWNPQL
jgi:pimeloyl-ACP methyl ester carboxylesterase